MIFRRTADVRSCGYIELFVLSKEDVMSSIRDYPEAQRILAKHGRKRLALGSKVASGPRDETTSGSNSDSEIELKITRPESDVSSQSLFDENGVIENSNSVTQKVTHTTVDIKEDSVFEDTPTKECSPSKFLVSPRQSVFLDTPHQKSVSMVHLKRSSIGSQGNVVGPATSLKSLDKRSLEKSLSQSISRKTSPHRRHRLAAIDLSSDEDDDHDTDNDNTRTPTNNKRWLKPRSNSKKHMRRSNSDMQRRTRNRSQQHNERYVFSDGENKRHHHRNRWNNNSDNNNHKRSPSPSTLSQCSNATGNSLANNRHHYHSNNSNNSNHHNHHRKSATRNDDREASVTTPDEDIFLRSMKKLYLETTKHFKKRTVRYSGVHLSRLLSISISLHLD